MTADSSHSQASTPLIEARDICVTVPYYQPEARRLLTVPRHLLRGLYTGRTKRTEREIISDVSFTLKPGERLGIIGINGAGKSTLLRTLGGVYPITSGTLEVNGDAKGLFNINLGMNLEGTGVENIYLRGLQMGLGLEQIRERIDEVVRFSELGEAIHNPVSTYSTGMALRLAFSVSTMIEPDILLLDEWIGAGDVAFRDKAQARMNRLVDNSRGLVLATHNTTLMKTLCTRGLLMHGGRVRFYGPIEDALEAYTELVAELKMDADQQDSVQ